MLCMQAVTFFECQNLIVKDLKIHNAQQMHVTFKKSNHVLVSNLTVTSPEESPNTDGIHITKTQNIQITDSVIGTGMLLLPPLSFQIHSFIAFFLTVLCSLMKVMIVYPL